MLSCDAAYHRSTVSLRSRGQCFEKARDGSGSVCDANGRNCCIFSPKKVRRQLFFLRYFPRHLRLALCEARNHASPYIKTGTTPSSLSHTRDDGQRVLRRRVVSDGAGSDPQTPPRLATKRCARRKGDVDVGIFSIVENAFRHVSLSRWCRGGARGDQRNIRVVRRPHRRLIRPCVGGLLRHVVWAVPASLQPGGCTRTHTHTHTPPLLTSPLLSFWPPHFLFSDTAG